MKVLIATPAFGGQLSTEYFMSALGTRDLLHKHNVQHGFFTLSNESLIPRARNKCVKHMMENDYTHLIFIDADIGWEPFWVLKLLASEHPIIGGTYPIKDYPIKWNFNPLMGEERELPESGIIEVRHIPTGFLKIERKVFEKMQSICPSYESLELNIGGSILYTDYFPTGEHNSHYESEDWGFCRKAKEAGFKIYLDAGIRCSHVGYHVFNA